MSRRRRQQRLERVLGTPALFATAYGNVGSSIYYALGVTAVFALGLTPLVFLIAGVFFSATALTYAEGTVRYPEAGGSSSFARHAFNELASFGAAWAQMLNYIITIAISAFFVPHYLSIFWGPLKQNPWDVIGGSLVIVVLVLLNVVGIQESARLNIFLALIDFGTQLLLVLLGFALIFSPETLHANVHWGTAPTWSQFFLAIPVGMIAYTGIETVSNLAEETRDPVKSIPRSIGLVAVAVYAIYFTLPLIALSALPVHIIDGKETTLLALPPEKHGFQNDPVLGLVENLGISGLSLSVLKVYVGILAATILFIATNAGIIGASRITYSMATYRQLPEVFRRLHPKYKTPWLSLLVFAGFVSILVLLPGQTKFLGTMYSFGAMLSFTIAHAAIVQLRRRYRDEELAFRARPNVRVGGIDWPLFAVFGGIATGLAHPRLRHLRPLSPARRARIAHGDRTRARRDRAGDRARVPERPRAGRVAARVGGGGRSRLPAGRRARRLDRGADRDRDPARAAARRDAAGQDRAEGARPARRGEGDRRCLRRRRRREARACAPRGTGDRGRGRTPEQRDHRHGRAQAGRAPPPRPDLRRDRRLRAQERALSRDGGRRTPRRMRRGLRCLLQAGRASPGRPSAMTGRHATRQRADA